MMMAIIIRPIAVGSHGKNKLSISAIMFSLIHQSGNCPLFKPSKFPALAELVFVEE